MTEKTPVKQVTVVVVDDEQIARDGLRRMLAEISWLKWIGEAGSGTSAVEVIDRLKPDVVFMDVQMPGLSGIEVLKTISHQPYVIFTTAYAEHAAIGFELGALDYLLKPFGADRLETAMNRVRSAIGEPGGAPTLDRMRDALERGPLTRLFVRSGNSIVPISVESVEWFEASGDYVTAHVKGSRHMMHLALSHLEKRLDAGKFVRLHRAHVVNIDHVRAFKTEGRSQFAELLDGTRLPVSRANAQMVRNSSRWRQIGSTFGDDADSP